MIKCLLIAVLMSLTGRASADLSRTAAAILAQQPEAHVIAGQDGWRFLANELRHVAKGADWVAPAEPPDPPHADPLPALLELHRQLTELDIELVIVPVPARAVVVADKLPPVDGAAAPVTSSLSGLSAFLDHLRGQGMTVVDLHPILAGGPAGGDPLYCRTDSHWTPEGAARAAESVATILREQAWFANAPRTAMRRADPETLPITGDLAAPDGSGETVTWQRVARADGQPVIDETGPVLVLGDSHTLVFSTGGDMHAEDGGFVEHLAYALQLPVERIANRGSASTPPRIALFRKAAAQPDWLAGKRAVVYCFTARELTESLNGWRIVPVSPRFR